MALQTCDKHVTSDGEIAIVVYESYSRSYAVAKCPACELVAENERLQKRDGNAEIILVQPTDDDPFSQSKLDHVDFGVADNVYMVKLAE